jgi:hypothetical protein
MLSSFAHAGSPEKVHRFIGSVSNPGGRTRKDLLIAGIYPLIQESSGLFILNLTEWQLKNNRKFSFILLNY